jgi:hypothetical protein
MSAGLATFGPERLPGFRASFMARRREPTSASLVRVKHRQNPEVDRVLAETTCKDVADRVHLTIDHFLTRVANSERFELTTPIAPD